MLGGGDFRFAVKDDERKSGSLERNLSKIVQVVGKTRGIFVAFAVADAELSLIVRKNVNVRLDGVGASVQSLGDQLNRVWIVADDIKRAWAQAGVWRRLVARRFDGNALVETAGKGVFGLLKFTFLAGS